MQQDPVRQMDRRNDIKLHRTKKFLDSTNVKGAYNDGAEQEMNSLKFAFILNVAGFHILKSNVDNVF